MLHKCTPRVSPNCPPRRSPDTGRAFERSRDVGTVARHEYREESRTTLAVYAQSWLESYSGRTGRGIRPGTVAKYREDLETHVLPVLGTKRLAAITPGDVKRLAKRLADGGLARTTVRNVMAPLRALLATAVEEGLIRHNPAATLRLPGPEDAPVKALSEEELGRLVAEVDDEHRLMVRLFASTGLRVSELVALRWSDIDLAEGVVAVSERLHRGERGAPKTRYGRRVIPLSPGMVRELREHRLASRWSQDRQPVFASGAGTPMSRHNVYGRIVKPAAIRAGVPWAGLHTLRHTAASRWFRAGVDVKRVQAMLGHHDPAFTLRTYT